MTDVPAHIFVPGLATTDTDGVTSGVTVIIIPVLVTEAGLAQVAVLVSSQVTTSLLANVVVVNVALLVPALVPFTFH